MLLHEVLELPRAEGRREHARRGSAQVVAARVLDGETKVVVALVLL